MKTLLKTIDIVHHEVVKKDYDEVLCIMGGEGKGKTNVLLTIIDYWLQKQYGTVTEDMARKHIALDSAQFAQVLAGVKRFDPAGHDEAADLSARGAMQKQNRLYVEAYQIIRGDNLFTSLVIPSIFDLDSFFRRRRVRHLINVYARGRIAFWSNKRLRRMVEMNERLPFKNIMIVRPTFYDTVPKYNGPLRKVYDEMKREKMKEVRKRLAIAMKAMGQGEGMIHKHAKVMELIGQGLSIKDVGEKVGYTTRNVREIVKKYT